MDSCLPWENGVLDDTSHHSCNKLCSCISPFRTNPWCKPYHLNSVFAGFLSGQNNCLHVWQLVFWQLPCWTFPGNGTLPVSLQVTFRLWVHMHCSSWLSTWRWICCSFGSSRKPNTCLWNYFGPRVAARRLNIQSHLQDDLPMWPTHVKLNGLLISYQ